MNHLLVLSLVGVTALAALWVAVVIALWAIQERLVFFPPRQSSAPLAARRLAYTSADGVPLFAYVVGEPAPRCPVIIAFHGNADLSGWFVPWAIALAERTKGLVVIPEYRGYDGIAGSPTCAGVALDARAALAAASTLVTGCDSPIVYFGHSLGAAIAVDLAAGSPPATLILQSPFSTAQDMAKRMFFPGLTMVWSVISRVPYDNVRGVRALDCPVWVSHGERDRLIPARMGRAVFAAAAHAGQLLIVADAGHNDVPECGGERYWEWITAACDAATVAASG